MTKTLFALILASSSIASAGPRVAALEPAPDTTIDAGAPASSTPLPTAYVGLGGAVGADTSVDWVYGATSLDGGYRLTDSLYVRGRVDRSARIGYGAINQGIDLSSPRQTRTSVMTGLEARHCFSAQACITGGSDVGYRFADGKNSGGVTIVPRVGLDLGWEHLRIRPGLEANLTFSHQLDSSTGEPALQDIYLPGMGIGFTTAIAYQW